jgi:hypothetical protein
MLMTVLNVPESESTNQNVTAQIDTSKTRTKLVKNVTTNVLNVLLPESTVHYVLKKDRKPPQLVNVNMDNTNMMKNVTIVDTDVMLVKSPNTNVLNVLTIPETSTTNVTVKPVSMMSVKPNVNHVTVNVPNVRMITNVLNVTNPEL